MSKIIHPVTGGIFGTQFGNEMEQMFRSFSSSSHYDKCRKLADAIIKNSSLRNYLYSHIIMGQLIIIQYMQL
jgi:hypothetical protein